MISCFLKKEAHLYDRFEADFRGHGAAMIDAGLSVAVVPAIQLYTATALHQVIDIPFIILN
jgi:hypothetical protein